MSPASQNIKLKNYITVNKPQKHASCNTRRAFVFAPIPFRVPDVEVKPTVHRRSEPNFFICMRNTVSKHALLHPSFNSTSTIVDLILFYTKKEFFTRLLRNIGIIHKKTDNHFVECGKSLKIINF